MFWMLSNEMTWRWISYIEENSVGVRVRAGESNIRPAGRTRPDEGSNPTQQFSVHVPNKNDFVDCNGIERFEKRASLFLH